jgi:hypothetical protein
MTRILRAGSFRKTPCSLYSTAWARATSRCTLPIDLRDLGRGMHGLSRRRSGGSACVQVQVRDNGRIPARSEAREAAPPHEGLGRLHRRRQRRPDANRRLASSAGIGVAARFACGSHVLQMKESPARRGFLSFPPSMLSAMLRAALSTRFSALSVNRLWCLTVSFTDSLSQPTS